MAATRNDLDVIFRDYVSILEDIDLQGENFERERALECIDTIGEGFAAGLLNQTQAFNMTRVLARSSMGFELDDEAMREIALTRDYLNNVGDVGSDD